MKIHKNPHYKKLRGSHILEIRCAFCKSFVANYQKVTKGNLVKMHIDRIIESSLNFSQLHGALFCPVCGERIATRYTAKIDKKEVYRLVPSAFNKKRVVNERLKEDAE